MQGETKAPFGTLLCEIPNAGWVHDVKWSADGTQLAWVAHDSTLNVLPWVLNAPASDIAAPTTVKVPGLPFRTLLWLSATTIVAAGYDCSPFVFGRKNGNGGVWTMGKALDQADSEGGSSKSGGGGNVSSALAMFKSRDRVGGGGDGSSASKGPADSPDVLPTKHQNCITALEIYARGSDGLSVEAFSSSGVDGRIVMWYTSDKELAEELSKLSI